MDNGLKEKLQNAGMIAGGYLAYRRVGHSFAKMSQVVQDRYGFDKNPLTKEVSDEFISAFNEARKAYPSYDKTLKFEDFSDKKVMLSSFKKEILSNKKELEKLIAWMPEGNLKEFYRKQFESISKKHVKEIKKQYRIVRDGKNAFYRYQTNTIRINMRNKAGAVFHEFGHHVDLSRLPKFLLHGVSLLRNRNFRGMTYWAILLTAMLTPEQKKDVKVVKPDKDVDKSKQIHPFRKFVKNNCALLAAGISVPYVLEEINASIVGQRIGSKFLKSPQAKRLLKKSHIGSAISYVSAPVVAGTAMYCANLFRDKVLADKILKNN